MSGPFPSDNPGPDGRTIPSAPFIPPGQAPASAPAQAPVYPAGSYPIPQPPYLQSPLPQPGYPQLPNPPPMQGFAPPQQLFPQARQPNIAGGFSIAGLWLAILACVFGAVGSTGTQVFYSVWYGAFPTALVALVLSCIGLSLRARRVAAWFGVVLSILCLVGMFSFMLGQYNLTHPPQ